MLFSTVFTALLLSGSALSAPLFGSDVAPPAPAGAFKQTSRDEILRRKSRPQRRAHISPALPPARFGNYFYQGQTAGVRPTETPTSSRLISATLSQNDVIADCMSTATYPTTANTYIWYSNSGDIWHCDFYTTRPTINGGTVDADVEYITGYQYSLP